MDENRSPSELLTALEHAGRNPDLELLQRCLEEREALTPTLLHWLDQVGSLEEKEWDEDDPRWYRAIHAGMLLIAYRETAALPAFGRIFRDSEQNNLVEWFSEEIPAYGPAATDWAIELAQDRRVPEYPRSAAIEISLYIAWHCPDERKRIVDAWRELLPPRNADGELVLLPDIDADTIQIWSWAGSALAQLHDRVTEPQIMALYAENLIDTFILGDVDEYRRLLTSGEVPRSLEPRSFDVVENYRRVAEADRRSAEWKRQTQARRDALEESSIAQAPPAPDLAPASAQTPAQAASRWEKQQPYIRTEPKVGRNDPCPCGSGKKYKHCHGKKQ